MITDIALLVFLVLSAFTDLKYRKIYNAVVLPAALAGFALNCQAHGFGGFADSLLGMLAGGAFLLPVYLLGGVGAGDVKFMAAIGALEGVSFVLYGGLYGALFGALAAVVVLLVRRRLFSTLTTVGSALFLTVTFQTHKALRFDKTGAIHLPYAALLALGMLARFIEQH